MSLSSDAKLSELTPEAALLNRMRQIIADPQHPLMAASLGVMKNGKILFSETVGQKQLDGQPATPDTKFRTASISKLITAVGIWQLIEQGLLSPDDDASRYLGFPLRNPHHPGIPITVGMLLSHTSSVREGGGKPGTYNIPYGHSIQEFFTEGQPCHNPHCWAPAEEVPGEFFAYCNMNYCLLGTILEAVSGQRFDHYMTDHVFAPMGLTCSFHVAGMSPAAQTQIGTLYRKLNEAGDCDPLNGTWIPQCDDFTNGYPTEDYPGYLPGTNGSLFGPMGSLRISIRELCQFMQMFSSGGRHNGVQILKPETIEKMFTPAWTYDPAKRNGDTYFGMMNCYGMGPHIFTNTPMGDRLAQHQVLPFAGHTADAYGLLGGMVFDRKKGNGIVYIVAGTGSDKNEYWGNYSAFYGWEESLLTAGTQFARFDY